MLGDLLLDDSDGIFLDGLLAGSQGKEGQRGERMRRQSHAHGQEEGGEFAFNAGMRDLRPATV